MQEIVEDRETPRAAVHAVTKNWTRLSLNRSPGRRERLPTLAFWPREFHRLWSPWDRKESDTTERLSLLLTSIDHPLHQRKTRPDEVKIVSPYSMPSRSEGQHHPPATYCHMESWHSNKTYQVRCATEINHKIQEKRLKTGTGSQVILTSIRYELDL